MKVGVCQEASSLGLRSKRRLFIASSTLSRGGDSSLDGSWPPVMWKGSDPLLAATPQLCFRPACRPSWPTDFSHSSLFFFEISDFSSQVL
ncbi:unnamed protein product [Spirodela intermedia]|uniref:Uncharacterized protein n=1 Tax=Spirodela intermedia TaxID=51605 RepID=A0ABN7E9T6_SPIIN|nr:unnamed protein product [Spirodela intermedia]